MHRKESNYKHLIYYIQNYKMLHTLFSKYYINIPNAFTIISYLSAFRPRGVPEPTSKLSPRASAQMGRRETKREGGKTGGRQA
jgi:hypothetical protein